MQRECETYSRRMADWAGLESHSQLIPAPVANAAVEDMTKPVIESPRARGSSRVHSRIIAMGGKPRGEKRQTNSGEKPSKAAPLCTHAVKPSRRPKLRTRFAACRRALTRAMHRKSSRFARAERPGLVRTGCVPASTIGTVPGVYTAPSGRLLNGSRLAEWWSTTLVARACARTSRAKRPAGSCRPQR